MNKKVLLVPLAAMTLSLVGCGEPDVDYTDNTRLTMRVHVDEGSEEGNGYKEIITAFNRENNGKIRVDLEFVARSGGIYETQLDNDKRKNTLPDLFTFDAPKCAYYAKNGYLYDLSSSFSTTEQNNFVALNRYQSKLFGVPIQESSAGIYYNKDLFNRAGIDVSGITVDNPWTFTQFKEACAKLKALPGLKGAVDMRLDATADETATYLLYPFIYSCGGSFVDSTGLHALNYFNSANSKKGFQFLKDLLDNGYTGTNYGAQDFFTHQVGMYLSSGWTIPELDNHQKWGQYFPDRNSWGLLPYPKADDGTAVSCNGSWSYAIGNNPRTDKSNVVTLLKYITNAKSSKVITQHTGMIPANKEAQVGYANPGSAEDVLLQQLNKTSEQRPETVGYAQFSAAFGRAIKYLRENGVDKSVDDAAQYLELELGRLK